nr:outward-rectifier potassium channel tok1 [Quercus suber]
MLFFIWLAGGGAVFSRIETDYGTQGQDWSYVNALYYCDVTILTVGFGDLYPSSNTGRGLVFPYSVLGIIMLGLMVSSITRFASELGSEKVIRRHVERSRARTVGRTVTTSMELEHRRAALTGERPVISAPFRLDDSTPTRSNTADSTTTSGADPSRPPTRTSSHNPLQVLRKVATIGPIRRRTKTPRLILLREEKDRFDAMRSIQRSTAKFKRWYALSMSIFAFGLLWCVGALVFYICERNTQGMTYFQALYFCYVSLLTIGYGDLSPKSNPGRPFFVFWSLIAVPTMTILVSDLGDTVINKFKRGTFTIADFTVLPQRGVWRKFIEHYPRINAWLLTRKQTRDAKRRLEEGFQTGPEPDAGRPATIDQLAADQPSHEELARRLPDAIKRTAEHMTGDPTKRYTYEEWVELTRLIRFTARGDTERETDNDDNDDDFEEGLIEWDWIGEDSPMMSQGSESEFVMDRLLESMNRYIHNRSASARTQGGTRRRMKNADGDADGDEDGEKPRTAVSSGSDASTAAEAGDCQRVFLDHHAEARGIEVQSRLLRYVHTTFTDGEELTLPRTRQLDKTRYTTRKKLKMTNAQHESRWRFPNNKNVNSSRQRRCPAHQTSVESA